MATASPIARKASAIVPKSNTEADAGLVTLVGSPAFGYSAAVGSELSAGPDGTRFLPKVRTTVEYD